MMGLKAATLGVALAHADIAVREERGNNMGPMVRRYLKNCDPPISVAAPWCAAFVQYCADVAARGLKATNPLDEVRLEALVASYYEWAKASGHIVWQRWQGGAVEGIGRGDLVLYQFDGKPTWNHMGIVTVPPLAHTGGTLGDFIAVEGNTGSDGEKREGDGVYVKRRSVLAGYPVCFVRWAD